MTAGKYNDGAHENRAVLAERLYQGMVAAWDNTEKTPLESASFRSSMVKVPPRQSKGFTREDLVAVLSKQGTSTQHGMAAIGLSWLERAEREGGSGIIDLPLIDFNDGRAQLLLLPGEIYVEYQLFSQTVRPDSFVMTVGYGQSAPGYIPTQLHWDEKDGNLHGWG